MALLLCYANRVRGNVRLKTKRVSGIEVLRIFCMLAIIILHLYDYGGLSDYANETGGTVNAVADLIWSFFRAPVDIFVLITGYFMVQRPFDLKKTVQRSGKAYAPMLFYSLLITAVFFCATPAALLGKPAQIVQAFFPFFSRTWYFLSLYILLLLLSPFMNMVMQKLDRRSFRFLLGILFVVMSVWPTVAEMAPFNQVISVTKIVSLSYGKSLGSFLLYYVLGAYLQRFSHSHEKPQWRYLGLFVLCCLVDFGLDRLFFAYPSVYHRVFGAFNNPLVVIQAAALFLFFRDWKFYSPIVNRLAGTTIGVYAIHEHPLVRNFIWDKLAFSPAAFEKNPAYLLWLPVMIAGIFLACSLVDLGRQGLFYLVLRLKERIKERGKAGE